MKYVANVQGNAHAEVGFKKNLRATLLKSHFHVGVLLLHTYKFATYFQNTFLQ